MAQAPVSNSPPQPAALCFSDTIRKVDRAVARLEELQCMVRTNHRNATFAKCSPPTVRAKLALHAGDHFLNKSGGNGAQKYAQHASSGKPALSTMCDDAQQKRHIHSNRSSGLPVAMSRRSARVADFSPLPPQKQVNSSTAGVRKNFVLPSRVKSPPSMPLSSPPSSACSSSVQVVTRRARPNKHIASSQLPKTCSANAGPAHLHADSLKPPRTFIVHSGQANPNRPWCLSSSQSAATNSSTTSNYIYTPSSNSSAPLPTKSPSRFSPLHRQTSGKCHESLQMQPLLCKSLECVSKPIKTSPNHPQKVPWFSQSRLSLTPPSLSTKRFSLISSKYKESPPRPLPALITRLPTRRKKALSPVKKTAASSNKKTQICRGSRYDGSPQEVPTMIGRPPGIALESPSKRSASLPIPPLPLPPALQVLPCSIQHNPTSPSSCKVKALHKRSSSCPRQCLLPVADSVTDVNHCNVSSSPLSAKDTKGACFQSTGKENCFSGCGPAAWPCSRRSWSFRERCSLENFNLTGAGPYLRRHGNGYMQKGKNTRAQPHMYKADSFAPEPNQDQPKLYIG